MPVTRSTREATSRDTDAVNPKKKAGSWLREQRQKAGLSQMDLAIKLGFKYYTFISQIENGYGRVPSQSMADWARALGLRPERFARFYWVTTTQRYTVFCSRMDCHERGLSGLRAKQ
jgi:transcriptional regulator with XRE-family HTH domain